MLANKVKTSRPVSKTHSVHTMQDDLSAAPLPSRFDLRHRRPLPKSKRMEDLRTPIENKDAQYPLPSTDHNQTLKAPTKKKSILSGPIIIWSIGLTLGLILFVIIRAIMSLL